MGRISRVWALAAVVLLAACSDQNARDVTSPQAPPGGPQLGGAVGGCTVAASTITTEITNLFVQNAWPNQQSAQAKWTQVQAYLNQTPPDVQAAQLYTEFTLIPFLKTKATKASELTAPNFTNLVADLYCYVGLTGAVYDLNPGDPIKTFVVPGVGGVQFPAPNPVPTGTIVVIKELPATPKPLLSPLDQFSGSLSIELIPNFTGWDPNNLPIIVLCPSVPATELGEFYVGHQASTGFEILPAPDAIPLELSQNCDAAVQNDGPTGWLATWVTRAASLLLPDALQASMMGSLSIGGKGGSFSPFGTTSTTLTALGGKGSSFSPRAMPSGTGPSKEPALSVPGPIDPSDVTSSGAIGTAQDSGTAVLPSVTLRTQGSDPDGVNPIVGVKVTFTIGATNGYSPYTASGAKFCDASAPTDRTKDLTSVDVPTDDQGKAEVPCLSFGGKAGFANVSGEIVLSSLPFSGSDLLSILGGATTRNWLIQALPGVPAKLVVTTPTTGYVDATAGGPLSPQPVVEVQDASDPGNNTYVDGTSVTATVAKSAGSPDACIAGSLGGTTTQSTVNGDATFTNLSVGGTVGCTYVLTFTSGELTAAIRNVTITAPGPASQLAITTQPPGTAQAGVAFGSPAVTVQDQFGNTVTTAAGKVTASIATGDPTLAGTTEVNLASGVATFGNLQINGATGDRTLKFIWAGGQTSPNSSTITVGAGPAASIQTYMPPSIPILLQTYLYPGTLPEGFPANPSPQVKVMDTWGNGVSGTSITWATNTANGSTVVGPSSNAGGLASAAWTLGNGLNILTATITVSGTPAEFTANTPTGDSVFGCAVSGSKTDIGGMNFPKPNPLGAIRTITLWMSVTGQASVEATYHANVSVSRNSSTGLLLGSLTNGQIVLPGNNGTPRPITLTLTDPVTIAEYGTGSTTTTLWLNVGFTDLPGTRKIQVWYNNSITKSNQGPCYSSLVYNPGSTTLFKRGLGINVTN